MHWIQLIGPVLIVIGMVLTVHGSRRQHRERSRATGTVLRWDHAKVGSRVPGTSKRSLPVVAFTTPDGRAIEAMPPYAADRGVYRTGQSAEVFFDPSDPQDIRVRLGWLDRPWAMVIVVGMGLTLLTIAVPLALRILA